MQAGYITMSRQKSLHSGAEEYAPMAYADTSKENDDGLLLIHRGATIFPTYEAAEQALIETLKKAEAAGYEWPRKKEYAIVEVRYPVNAAAKEVSGEGATLPSDLGLVARLRRRTLAKHGGRESDSWEHHWNLTEGDSKLHADAIAEIERLQAAASLEATQEHILQAMRDLCQYADDTVWLTPQETVFERLEAIYKSAGGDHAALALEWPEIFAYSKT